MKRFLLIFIFGLLINFVVIEGTMAAGFSSGSGLGSGLGSGSGAGLGPAAMRYWGAKLPEDPLTIENPSQIVPAPEIRDLIEKYNPQLPEEQKQTIIEAILQSAERHGLDPILVASVIAAESSFRPRARSRCDARGLMQLTRMVWPYVGVQDPYDIEQNIEGGCIFLAKQLSRFQSVELCLAAYNAGPGIVGKLKRIPNYPETINYVKKVTRLTNELSTKYEARKAAVTATYLAVNIKPSPDPAFDFLPPGRLNEWYEQDSPCPDEAVDRGSEADAEGAGTEGDWYEAPIQCLPDQKRTLNHICMYSSATANSTSSTTPSLATCLTNLPRLSCPD